LGVAGVCGQWPGKCAPLFPVATRIEHCPARAQTPWATGGIPSAARDESIEETSWPSDTGARQRSTVTSTMTRCTVAPLDTEHAGPDRSAALGRFWALPALC